jgi:hypothetical protein
VLKKVGVLLMIEEYIERRQETIMKYTQMVRNIYGKCKSLSQKIASNLLWWEVKYYSDDVAEALTSLAPIGSSAVHASSIHT